MRLAAGTRQILRASEQVSDVKSRFDETHSPRVARGIPPRRVESTHDVLVVRVNYSLTVTRQRVSFTLFTRLRGRRGRRRLASKERLYTYLDV